jgi:haloalkane dehalogenase
MSEPHGLELPGYIARNYPFPRASLALPWGKVHYVDTGGAHRPVLLLHGNPTWSFLYRKVMRELQGEPLRLVAPDLIGLGLSDKPRDWREHSLRRHGETLLAFVRGLDLRNLILVVQDWGGPIGGWMAAQAPDRIGAVLVMNTSLLVPAHFRTTAFHRFAQTPAASDLAFRGLNFPVRFMSRAQGDPASIDAAARKAYFWPLRNLLDRAAPLALARMVPNTPEHPTTAELTGVEQWFDGFLGPVEFVWGARDPILGRSLKRHRERKPAARVTETQAGHFLQEEVPELIAQAIVRLDGR